MAGSTNPTPVVSAAWVAERIRGGSVAVIEVAEDGSAKAGSRIPGAVSLDWRRELRTGPGRDDASSDDFISGDELAELLGSKGVSSDQTIVLYGRRGDGLATQAYWLFAHRGVADAVVLGGGGAAWETERRLMTSDSRRPAPRSFIRGRERPELRVFGYAALGARELLDLGAGASGLNARPGAPGDARGGRGDRRDQRADRAAGGLSTPQLELAAALSGSPGSVGE